MLNDFNGITFRLADNLYSHVEIEKYKDRPIKYLEIGTLYGANILSVAKTYGSHKDSELYCIDPWEDYQDYPEYKTMLPKIYDIFIENDIMMEDDIDYYLVCLNYNNNIGVD